MTFARLIPPEYRIAAQIAVVAALMGLAAAGGWAVATWKADSVHAVVVAGLTGKVHTLELDVAAQNAATDKLAAEKAVAERAAKAAQERVVAEGLKTDERFRRIGAIKATDCDGAIKEYWEIRR